MVALLAAGCVGPAHGLSPPREGEAVTPVWVVSHGWHTGIVVRGRDVPENLWPQHRDFPEAEFLEVGWGERAFYMAPAGTSGMALRAALWPSPSVLHVAEFSSPVERYFPASEIVEIALSRRGLQGLAAFLQEAYLVACGDCHNNDQWTPTGTQPRGAHGSRYAPLLERNYELNDPASESYQSYAMCYKCHNRDFLINDRAGTFLHKKHVVQAQTPRAVCHDAHGSRRHVGLINFMIRDRTGKTVVSQSQSSKRLEFVSQGAGRGQCYLACHGKNHEPASYP